MPKRIAFLTTQYSEVKSGPGRFAQYLKESPIEGIEITFFSEQIAQNQGNEIAIKIPAWLKKLPFSWIFKAWFYALSVKVEHQKKPFDAILSSDFSLAIFINGALAKRLFTMVNDDNYLLIYQPGDHQKAMSTGRRWARRIGYFFERQVARRSAFVVSNSHYTRNLVEKIYQIPPHHSLLLYKAVNLSRFTRKERPERAPKHFLFVKNDWRRGGLDLIFQALAKLQNQEEIHFKVAGISGQQQSLVEEMARKSGFRGTWTIQGLLKREQLIEALHSADLFLSMSRQEALGVSCLEAMATGLPVIATEVGGLPEVLDFGHAGWLIPKNDVESLVQTLEDLRLHPERIREKTLHACMHAEKFSVECLKVNFRNLFERP